jgi:phage/plasmid-associated DNA primase
MRNKRLNIAGEVSRNVKPIQFKIFKEITGGDSVFVDIKNKESQSVTFTAKQLFLGNFLPDFPADDDSLYDRFNVIYFNNTIPREERDPDLFDKLTENIDYFALWCLKGLRRYIKNNNCFTEDEDSNDYFMCHIEKSNSSMAFIQKFIIKGNDDEFITNSELYELYVRFCHEKALTVHSRQKLFSNIQEIFPQSKRGREYVDNERPQVIHGIKIYREDIL